MKHEVMIIDDLQENVELLSRYLQNEGYVVRTAKDGATALRSIQAKAPDIVLLDIRMPGVDGLEVCRRLKADPRTSAIPVIFISAQNDTDAKIEAFRAGGVDYITKPFSNEEVIARVTTQLKLFDYQHHLEKKIEERVAEIKKLNYDLEQTQEEMIMSLSALMETRDESTGKHVVRVAEFSKRLAELAGLEREKIDLIHKAAPLHDAGKVAIPDRILNKKGPLTQQEWEIMKTHSIKGYEIFKDSTRPVLQMAAVIAKEHHERWDGSGYPFGLKEEQIDIAGRIVIIADVFDALSHKRVYKEAWPVDEVRSFMSQNGGVMFDPGLLELFLKHFDDFVEIRNTLRD